MNQIPGLGAISFRGVGVQGLVPFHFVQGSGGQRHEKILDALSTATDSSPSWCAVLFLQQYLGSPVPVGSDQPRVLQAGHVLKPDCCFDTGTNTMYRYLQWHGWSLFNR
jgi:hypothetical protein